MVDKLMSCRGELQKFLIEYHTWGKKKTRFILLAKKLKQEKFNSFLIEKDLSDNSDKILLLHSCQKSFKKS